MLLGYYISAHLNGFSQSGFINKLSVNVVTFLNVAMSMNVLWTWSTSAKHARQRITRKQWIIKKSFCNIIKWAIIQRTFGHGPKVLYVKWSNGPSSGHFYADATETSLLA